MPLNIISITVNAIFLVIALYFAIRLMRGGSRFQFNVGNPEIQAIMKWIILRSIIILVFLGVVATVFNLVVFFLPAP